MRHAICVGNDAAVKDWLLQRHDPCRNPLKGALSDRAGKQEQGLKNSMFQKLPSG